MTLAAPIGFEYLSSKLTGDATLMALGSPPLSTGLRIFPDEAPPGSLYPFLVYSFIFATPLKVTGNVTIWSSILLLVKGIDLGRSTVNLAPMLNRVDAILDSSRGQVSTGQVFAAIADEEINYLEVAQGGGGPRYRHLGRRWRLLAQ